MTTLKGRKRSLTACHLQNRYRLITHRDKSHQSVTNRRLDFNFKKGGNFAIIPNTIPIEDIIFNIESAIRSLPECEAEEIRCESSRILRKAKTPKCNIKHSEKLAIKELNDNKNILILPADKGNATVVIETDDYKWKILDLLDLDTYRKLPKDLTSKILR